MRDPESLITLDATVHQVQYQRTDPDFSVIRAWTLQREPVTLAGPIAPTLAIPYVTLRCLGRWTTHPRYGRQFSVETAMLTPPNTPRALVRYLKASRCPKLGAKTAERLVDAFGEDTLAILRTAPERVAHLPKISAERATAWQRFFQTQLAVEPMITWCLQHGVDPQYATSLIQALGIDAIRRLEANPYVLCRDPWHVPFLTADRIARTQGTDPLAPVRLQALWTYALGQASAAGHTIQSTEALMEAIARHLRQTNPQIDADSLRIALSRSILQLTPAQTLAHPWTRHGDTWALRTMHWQEHQLAQRMGEHLRRPVRPPSASGLPRSMPDLPAYSPQQHAAIDTCLRQRFTCLTGGPGTGKTTLIHGLITRLVHQYHVPSDAIALAAPTAQAAQRLRAVTHHRAQTLHRLLGWEPGGFTYHADHPLPYTWIIVDEASMIALPLAHAFWDAVPPTAQVVWVGDVDQIPSVGPGAILRDCLHEPRIPQVRLTENFRADAPLAEGARRILQGQMPEPHAAWTWHVFARSPDPAYVHRVLLAYLDRLTQSTPWQSIHVLTGIHQGPLGTEGLNALLRDHWNPDHPEATQWPAAEHRTYRLHDRVMQLRNDYTRNIFNGEIGSITAPPLSADALATDPSDPPVLWVRFPYRPTPVPYTWSETQWLTWAYCSTVHKAQALEYPIVCALVFWEQGRLLYRNLLYTAVTRAQTRLLLLSEEGAIEHAIATTDPQIRQTGLPAAFARQFLDAQAQ